MFGFGSSKKKDEKNSGGFGLPGISLGKAEKTIGQGLGQATNTVRDTGKKVENFLFGHSNTQSNSNGVQQTGGSKVGLGFGLPSLSLDKSGKTISQGIGTTSNTIKKTGENVENFLFGKTGSQNNKAGISGNLGVGLALPDLKLGGTQAFGQALGETSDALGKTGKKVDDFLFGHSTKQKNITGTVGGLDAKIGGFGLPNISLGKAEEKLNLGLGQVGNTINKTGAKVENFLFGKPKNQSINGSGVENNSKIGGSFGLPNLSFGKAGHEIDKGIEQTGNTIKKTGEKVDDFLFGKPKNIDTGLGIGLDAKTGGGFGLPNLSLGKANVNINQGVGLAGSNLQKTGEKAENFLFGHSMNASTTIPNATIGGGIGLPSISLGGVEDAARRGLGQAGDTLNKTGKKVEDFLFGSSKNQKGKNELSIGLDAKTGGGFGLPNLSLGKANVNINQGVGLAGSNLQKTGEKAENFLFGHWINASTTIPNATIGGGFGLPSISLGGVEDAALRGLGQAGDTLNKTGKKVEDFLFGNSKNQKGKNELSIGLPGIGGFAINETSQTIGGPKVNTTFDVSSQIDKAGGIGNIPGKNQLTGISNITGSFDLLGKKVKEGIGKIGESGSNTATSILENNVTSEIDASKLDGLVNMQKTTTILPNSLSTGSVNIKDDNEGLTEVETTLTPLSDLNSQKGTPSISLEPNKNTATFDDIPNSTETSESHTTSIIEANTLSPTNSLEESAIGLFGASEIPSNPSTKSEETLRKIEDILKGSGTDTSIVGFTSERTKFEDLTPIEKPSPLPEFTYTNEELEESATLKPEQSFNTSIAEEESNLPTSRQNASGPVILPPYFVVPNSNGTIGEQNVPLLPPTVFDQPTGDKARFIPILPPMEPSTGNPPPGFPNIMTTNTPVPPTYRSLTPAEYGAIGIGSVLILALVAFIYQKYKQFSSGSSGGSYSPKNQERKAAGRKRSTRSDTSEEGPSPETNEVYRSTTTPVPPDQTNSDVTVVEIEPAVDAVEEIAGTPMTKTVVNSLQKSSNPGSKDEIPSPEDSDNFKVVSEIQKNSSIEKPPRKSRTPSGSPERFTSDKTSASNLNEESLKNVSHAIGGILRNQAPNQTNTKPNKIETESNAEKEDKGNNSAQKNPIKPVNNANNPQKPQVVQVNTKTDTPETVLTDSEPLYKSLEGEVDAGSEYYSADENNEIKSTPPPSPLTKETIMKFPDENLRAEDVYNNEIVSEDGRRRSIEEDIADSLESEESSDKLSIRASTSVMMEEINKESLKPSAPLLTSEEIFISIPSVKQDDLKYLSEDIVLRNLINSDKNQRYLKQDAEDIVDDILRSSQLDALTKESIRKDLGTPATEKPQVKLSPDSQSHMNDKVVINSGYNQAIGKIQDKTKFVPQTEPPSDFLKELSEKSQKDHCKTNEVQETVKNEDKIKATNIPADARFKNNSSAEHIESAALHSGILSQTNLCTCPAEDGIGMTSTSYLMDEDYTTPHKFEFIPPRQPHSLEDDLIVFSHSDQESITPLSDSIELKLPNKECSTNNHDERTQINSGTFEMGPERMRSVEGNLVAEAKSTEVWGSIDDVEKKPRTIWYVPNDEILETELKKEIEKSADDLYIVLSEESTGLSPCNVEENIPKGASFYNEHASRSTTGGNRHSPKISYAFIEIHDDPMLETWPEHLPKNIHSISGVGLAKAPDESSLLSNILREESEVIPSTSNLQSSDEPKVKPIPQFILPNMESRKKRMSRRRQIKSLDSGVHHYYGEYLSLAEVPEIENENVGKGGDLKKDDTASVQEVLTIQSDGTIIQEKIVIE